MGPDTLPSTAYMFTHRLLPGLVHGNPRTLTNELFFSAREELITRIWREAETYASDPQAEVPAALGFEVDERPRFSIGIVTLPPPQALADAHFVAIVVERAGLGPVQEESFRGVRYFTLEHGNTASPDGGEVADRTVLCEWSDGAHHNYGTGPAVEKQAFVTEVLRKKLFKRSTRLSHEAFGTLSSDKSSGYLLSHSLSRR